MKAKIGDMLWVYLKGAQNDYGYGEVFETYTSPEGVELFCFFCLVNGGQRTGKVENIIDKPTGRMVGKLDQSQREIREVLKEKR